MHDHAPSGPALTDSMGIASHRCRWSVACLFTFMAEAARQVQECAKANSEHDQEWITCNLASTLPHRLVMSGTIMEHQGEFLMALSGSHLQWECYSIRGICPL